MNFEYGEENADQEATKIKTMTNVTWKDYILKYRSSLVSTLEEQYKGKMTNEFLTDRVELLFPDSNFYFYQIRDD